MPAAVPGRSFRCEKRGKSSNQKKVDVKQDGFFRVVQRMPARPIFLYWAQHGGIVSRCFLRRAGQPDVLK